MKKLLVALVILAMLNMNCVCATAEPDLLEALLNATEQGVDIGSFDTLQKILMTRGYQVSFVSNEGCDLNNLYDCILAICEREYGSYYTWTLAQRYGFDLFMVRLGQLPCCINLDPASDVISQEVALDVAISEIAERYGTLYTTSDYCTAVSYCAVESGSTQGMWRFGVEFSDGNLFTVHVLHGKATHCTREKRIGSLETEYNDLCEQRGAFFKWLLPEKMEYANSLPDKLRIAQEKNEMNMCYDELVSISRYGFILPEIDDLPQDSARLIAMQAVQAEYSLPDDWYTKAEIFYSFFCKPIGKRIWRIIIWDTGNSIFPSGVVELNSESGEVLKIEKNGTKPNEFIPYLDRI